MMMFIQLLSQSPQIEIDKNIFAQQILESSMNKDNLGMHMVNVLPNVRYQPHSHPYDHYLIVLEGNGFANLNNKAYQLTVGCLILIPKDIIHTVGAKELGMKILVISHDSLGLKDPKRMTFT